MQGPKDDITRRLNDHADRLEQIRDNATADGFILGVCWGGFFGLCFGALIGAGV